MENTSQTISFQPIGIIYTPYNTIEDMPIQPKAAEGNTGHIELLPDLTDGLKDLDGFSHIILLYHLHKVKDYSLLVTPFMDTVQHGVYATRAPKRPNPIGLSIVRLTGIKDNVLQIQNVDMLNGTPLIDIKPFFPVFDNQYDTRSGWLDKINDKKIHTFRSDNRFK